MSDREPADDPEDALRRWRRYYSDTTGDERATVQRDVFAMFAWQKFGDLDHDDHSEYRKRGATRWAERFQKGVADVLQLADAGNTEMILKAMIRPGGGTGPCLSEEDLEGVIA